MVFMVGLLVVGMGSAVAVLVATAIPRSRPVVTVTLPDAALIVWRMAIVRVCAAIRVRVFGSAVRDAVLLRFGGRVAVSPLVVVDVGTATRTAVV